MAAGNRPRDTIALKGLSAFGHHGVFDDERAAGQTFVVDVLAHLDTTQAGASDDLTKTVDYGQVAAEVVAVVAGAPVRLIETLAARIADVVLAHERIEAVEISVHKAQAPIPVEFSDVVVTIRRERSDVAPRDETTRSTFAEPEPASGPIEAVPATIGQLVAANATPPAAQRPAAAPEPVAAEPAAPPAIFAPVPVVAPPPANVAAAVPPMPVAPAPHAPSPPPFEPTATGTGPIPLSSPLASGPIPVLSSPIESAQIPIAQPPASGPIPIGAGGPASGDIPRPPTPNAQTPSLEMPVADAPSPDHADLDSSEMRQADAEAAAPTAPTAPTAPPSGVSAADGPHAGQSAFADTALAASVFPDVPDARADDEQEQGGQTQGEATTMDLNVEEPPTEGGPADAEADAAGPDLVTQVLSGTESPAAGAALASGIDPRDPYAPPPTASNEIPIVTGISPLDTPPMPPADVVIALGGNQGDVPATLRQAIAHLAAVDGLDLLTVSPLARTAPVGDVAQPDFFNCVVIGRCSISPRALLAACQRIENMLGRVRETKWGPRTIDIDIIAFGSLVEYSDDLTIPHPLAAERAFVLLPWASAAPHAILPGLGGGPVAQLAESAPDRAGVRWLSLDWVGELSPISSAETGPANGS